MTYEQIFVGQMKLNSAVLHLRNRGNLTAAEQEAVEVMRSRWVVLQLEFNRKRKGRGSVKA